MKQPSIESLLFELSVNCIFFSASIIHLIYIGLFRHSFPVNYTCRESKSYRVVRKSMQFYRVLSSIYDATNIWQIWQIWQQLLDIFDLVQFMASLPSHAYFWPRGGIDESWLFELIVNFNFIDRSFQNKLNQIMCTKSFLVTPDLSLHWKAIFS